MAEIIARTTRRNATEAAKASAAPASPTWKERREHRKMLQDMRQEMEQYAEGSPVRHEIINDIADAAADFSARESKPSMEFTWADASRSETMTSLGTPDEQRIVQTIGQDMKASPAKALEFASLWTEHQVRDWSSAKDVMLNREDSAAFAEAFSYVPEEVAQRVEQAGALRDERFVRFFVGEGRRLLGGAR
jgi:hypothetical protein